MLPVSFLLRMFPFVQSEPDVSLASGFWFVQTVVSASFLARLRDHFIHDATSTKNIFEYQPQALGSVAGVRSTGVAVLFEASH